MAITRTTTWTATYTRVELIKMQVDRVLTRTGEDKNYIKNILNGIDKRLIKEISVYGLDSDGLCAAELFIDIDWPRSEIHISAGKHTVGIDSTWTDNIAVEVEKTLGLYLEFHRSQNLRTEVHTRYAAGVDRAQANKELGFAAAQKVSWRSGFVGTVMTVPELDEFSIGVRLAE